MAAGNARSAAAEVVGETPGEGNDHPHDRRHPPEPHTHELRGPVVLGARPHGDPPVGEPRPGEEPAEHHERHDQRGDPGLGDRDAEDLDRRALPRIAHGQDVDAEASGDLGLEHHVDADRHDGDRDDRAPYDGSDERPLDHECEEHGQGDAEEHRDRERLPGRAEAGRAVGAHHEQPRVGEVDDLRRLEHDDEPEGEQGVDRTERHPAEQQLQELLHHRTPIWGSSSSVPR
jgi:hypothetical protein